MFRNRRSKARQMMRDSVFNAIVGASARIQGRRQRKGKRRLVARDFSAINRRTGGAFAVPRKARSIRTLTKTAVRSVAANAAVTVRNQQSPSVRRESGTDYLGSFGSLTSTTSYQALWDAQINPADPNLFPGLSIIANQYQKFVIRGLKFTWKPMSPTTTAGNVYIAFSPDAQANAPTSEAEITQMVGTVTGLMYGDVTTFVVPQALLQQSFNVQTVLKPASETTAPLSM